MIPLSASMSLKLSLIKTKFHKIRKPIITFVFLISYFFVSYFPGFSDLKYTIDTVSAENFVMQTGGFVGNGDALVFENIGFTPDLVIVKPSTTAGGGAVFRSSSMIDNVDAFFINTANGAGGITLDTNGFRLMGGNVNAINVYYTWIAFGGSDCSATGSFCVGAYVGDGNASRSLTTVGFQPDLVWVKPSGSLQSSWRSSSMPSNYSQYFYGAAEVTDGSFFSSLTSTGFDVGTSNNTLNGIFYYVAFKNTTNKVAVGTYAGDVAAQNIDVGFQPDFVFLKNATTTAAAIYKTTEAYGRNSYYYSDLACLTGGITALITSPVSGFSVDTNAVVNGSGNTIYWAAFGGASDTRNSSGTFKMAKGTYTGTGTTGNYIVINNLDFAPDLVIVKGDTTQIGVFRTNTMAADSTAYLTGATTNFANGIVSLDPAGFTIGQSAVVNTSGATYYWEAYGNAWTEVKNSGASDFYIGAYYGNTIDNVDIGRLPFQANMVAIKGVTTAAAVFRTSSHSDDLTSYFQGTAETANIIQRFNTDGFQIGTNASVNSSIIVYHYFGFKNGSNFSVGSYDGNGTTQDINVGFQPDYIWIKHPSTTIGVERGSELAADQDGVFPFTALGKQTSSITAITSTGVTLSSSSYVNQASTNGYKYVAWRTNSTPVTPIFQMQTGGFVGNGDALVFDNLGFTPDLVMVKAATTAGGGAVFRSSSMIDNVDAFFINRANGAGGITLDTNGFRLMGGNVNSVNVYYTWIAFGGSDCSATGSFCVGAYVGDGNASRSLTTVGFQPDLVWVKPSGSLQSSWRSSSMPSNYSQYFYGAAEVTDGSFFSSLTSTGFDVGTSNNTLNGIFYYVAFKNTTNKVAVGTYAGDVAAQNIDVGFQPDFVFLKNATTTAAAIYKTTEAYGRNSYYYSDLACLTGGITALITSPVSGFSVDTNAVVNGSGNTIYWAAFGGASDTRNSSGTFKMAKGTYTGTGTTGNYIVINNLDFAPDLVIVKGDTTQIGVFRTNTMAADSTAYLTGATTNFANGIVSLDPAGFTIGQSAVVNTSGATYYWEAYGNAWTEVKNSGASDFYIGAYYGNTIDNVDIGRLPFQANMVAIKGVTTAAAVFRTSSHSDDLTSYFQGTAETANIIQRFNTDGFQIGTNASVNSSIIVYHYFGFKNGSNFSVGSYDGNGTTQDINVGFQPDYIWIKHPSTTIGVERGSELAADQDGVFPFTALGKQTSSITAITSTGVTLSSSSYVNQASTNGYKYVAWRLPSAVVVSIVVSDGVIDYEMMPVGSTKSTIDISDTQSVTNTGSTEVDLQIKGYDTSCPWLLGSAVNTDVYMYEFSLNSGGIWTPITKSNSTFKDNLESSGEQTFDLRLSTPSSTNCTSQQTVSVTILGSQ